MDGPIYHLERVVKVKTEDLEDFVGPLDLILHLLNKNKMEIKDIQISLILDQYLQWMSQRKELDLEVASEFVTMASHLVYIKTRMLLSIHDEEALSEMEQLIATLEAHQRNENYLKIREVVPQLDRRYSVGRDCLTKAPEAVRPDRTYRYVHPKEDLQRAMQAVLSRTDHKLPPPMSAFQGIVGREPYPVAEKAAELIQRLLHLGVARFRALFRGSRSQWMSQRKELDLEVASEFVTMASHLVYIKTRMLLSIHDEEALSEMEQLIATLEAHQRNENYLKIREVVPQLDRRYSVGRDCLTKAPEAVRPDRTYRYVHPKEDLQRAMQAVLSRTDHKLPPPMSAFQGIVGREPYPVAEKAAELIQRLLHLGVARFRALFRGSRSRSEVVATFLAVLELCKDRRLRLAGTAEDCTVTCTGPGEETGSEATERTEN